MSCPLGHPVCAINGPPYLWRAVCLKTTYTLMFSTGIDVYSLAKESIFSLPVKYEDTIERKG